jgi:ligand-binding sensor domain-containing protein
VCKRFRRSPCIFAAEMRSLSFLCLFIAGFVAPMRAQTPFYKNYQVKEGLLSNFVYCVFQDSKGYIWVSSDVGVSRFDGHTFTYYNTADGMSDNEVFSMYEDKKGRIWFATLNGKPCFYQNGYIYNEASHTYLKKGHLGNLVVKILETKEGQIIYASQSRVVWIDPDQHKLEVQNYVESIQSIWEEADGSLGVMSGDGLKRITKDKQMTRVVQLSRLALPIRCQPMDDHIVLTSAGQVYILDRRTGQIIQSFALPGEGNEVTHICTAPGQIWLGTRDGLFRYDYPSFQLIKKYLPGRTITSTMIDREAGWWISTLEEGLYYVPVPEMEFYSTGDGLLQKRVICLSRDAEKQLWIGGEASTYAIFDKGIQFARQILPVSVKNKNICNFRHLANGTTLVIGKSGTLVLQKDKESFFYQRSTDINIDKNGDYWIGLNGLYKVKAADAAHKMFPVSSMNQKNGYKLYERKPARRMEDKRVEKIVFDQEQRMWLAAPNGLYLYKDSMQSDCVLPHVTKDLLYDAQRNHESSSY